MDPGKYTLWIPVDRSGGSNEFQQGILVNASFESWWIPMVGLGEDTCGGSLWILLHPGVGSCWIPVIALGGSTLCVLVDPSC